jgi:hypothetical protein
VTGFLRRVAAAVVVGAIPLTAAAVAMSAVAVAAPGGSSPQCDLNWARNVWTGECHPQPAMPDWYVIRPAYAPPYAPIDVPPPPPPPWWAQGMHANWDEGSQQWVWVRM